MRVLEQYCNWAFAVVWAYGCDGPLGVTKYGYLESEWMRGHH